MNIANDRGKDKSPGIALTPSGIIKDYINYDCQEKACVEGSDPVAQKGTGVAAAVAGENNLPKALPQLFVATAPHTRPKVAIWTPYTHTTPHSSLHHTYLTASFTREMYFGNN